MSKNYERERIEESTVHLEVKLRALEKCIMLLAFIEATVLGHRGGYANEADRSLFVALLQQIRAAQGSTWSDLAMWSPLNARAAKLVKENLKKYTDEKINYSMEHLLPYSMRNSLTSRDELKQALKELLDETPAESNNDVVEVTVPKRAIDPQL